MLLGYLHRAQGRREVCPPAPSLPGSGSPVGFPVPQVPWGKRPDHPSGPAAYRYGLAPVPARRATARPNAGTGAEPPSAAPLAAMLANLTARGIGRLFAEGGTMIHTHLTSRRSDLVQYLKSR